MDSPDPNPPTQERVGKFQMVLPMLEAAQKEMAELSKKRQDGVLNELKVRYINRLLREAREVLGNDPSVAFVELLDEDSLPQNSDAVLVLGQWLAALTQFQNRHHGPDPDQSGYRHRWFTVEDPHPGLLDYDDDEFDEEEDEDR